LNKLLKAGLVSLIRSSGLPSSFRTRLRGQGAILCLHEIQEDPSSELMTGCTPSFLAEIVDSLRRDGWEFVSLDEAIRRIGSAPAARPFAVLTFDDGYRDSLTYALPALERLQAPFTVFVPTRAITRELYAWWLALRDLFRSHDAVSIECMDARFSCAGPAAKISVLRAVFHWVSQDFRRAFDLAPTFAAYGISLEALAEAYFLGEDELCQLARNPLVTIGAHTASHAALVTLEAVEARAEMVENKAFLEQLLDRDVMHFAFPYGAYGEREVALARETGFVSAVTTRSSPIYAKYRDTPHAMPRVGVRPGENETSLYYRVSGLSWALRAHKRGFAFG
jgi:peptidoglycan/xylan/chitin deacetylase (PgdA/CDA1 family)